MHSEVAQIAEEAIELYQQNLDRGMSEDSARWKVVIDMMACAKKAEEARCSKVAASGNEGDE